MSLIPKKKAVNFPVPTSLSCPTAVCVFYEFVLYKLTWRPVYESLHRGWVHLYTYCIKQDESTNFISYLHFVMKIVCTVFFILCCCQDRWKNSGWYTNTHVQLLPGV